ncbi:major facilitator superfamily domain-containing protein [Lipomyces chichibuensis]|uniref:major facilitator superfamily domain-containing protein n=1 Tax=Lipomyces chichibuensis TaxID=1546026 RepID=UPI003343E677
MATTTPVSLDRSSSLPLSVANPDLVASKETVPEKLSVNGSDSSDSSAANKESDIEVQIPKAPLRGPVPTPLTNLDKGLIGWESLDDPENPMNWTLKHKWRNMGIVAFSCFILPLASTLFAPGVSYVAAEFHETNSTILSLMVSIFVSGFAWGPLFFHAPLSELYGRKYVITCSNLLFAMFNIGCAWANGVNTFIACRFLGGLLGCASLVVGGGVISDIFRREEMGAASSVFALGPLLGPVIGPIIGGFLAERVGWRWNFRLLLILGCFMSAIFFFAVDETNAPAILRQKAYRKRKELGRPELISALDEFNKRSPAQVFWHGISRPIALLCTCPAVLFLGLYMAIAFSYMYIFLTTVAGVFTDIYHFSTGIAGLLYLGLGTGFLSGLLTVGSTNDKLVRHLTERNNGVRIPEFRLRPLLLSCILIPVAMVWYGWAVQRRAHWFAVVASMFPLGFGLVSSLLPIQTYLIEVYGPYGLAASATAAGNCLRMTAAAFFPLVAPTLFHHLDYGWGSTLLGLLALLMCASMALTFITFGQKLRERFPPKL